jgi:hypothetical protein
MDFTMQAYLQGALASSALACPPVVVAGGVTVPHSASGERKEAKRKRTDTVGPPQDPVTRTEAKKAR